MADSHHEHPATDAAPPEAGLLPSRAISLDVPAFASHGRPAAVKHM